MRRKLSFLLVIVLLVAMFVPANSLAATSNVYVNGIKVAAAAIKSGKVICLEAEPIIKALGMSYSESPVSLTERQIQIVRKNDTFNFSTGSTTMVANGKTVKLKSPAVLKGEFVYLPTSFFTDVLNLKYSAKSGVYYIGIAVELPEGVHYNKYDSNGVRLDYPSNWQQAQRPDPDSEHLALNADGDNESVIFTVIKSGVDLNQSANTKQIKEDFKALIKSITAKGSIKIKDYKAGSITGQYVEAPVSGGRYARIYVVWRGSKYVLLQFSCPTAKKAKFLPLVDYMMSTLAID